jgi:hypothetical protein
MAIAPNPTKTASILFFYYGDSKYLTVFQETLRMRRAMEGYDLTVLLKHQETPSFIDISEGDERNADVVDAPTQANLFKHLIQAAQSDHMVDLWIFSHGSTGNFRSSAGTHGSVDSVRAQEITTELSPAKTGLTQMPIRMLWTTACYNGSLNSAWTSIGAKAVSGARTTNFFPNRFGKFAEEWNKGNVTYAQALERSDTAASRGLVDTAMLAHATATRSKWGGCPVGRTILGDSPCAKQYFVQTWYERQSDYQDNLNGRENMAFGSEKIVAGTGSLTKNSRPTWT